MRKGIFLLLPLILITGCTNNASTQNQDQSNKQEQISETDKTVRYDIALTKDNLWYYIDYSFTSSGNSDYETVSCSFAGVLSYAYYDNVVIKMNYNIVGRGEPGSIYYPSTSHVAKVELKLNAAGCGGLAYKYDYVPENATPAITQGSLSGFNRSFEITAVEGMVHFAI